MLAKPVKKKKPMFKEILSDMVDNTQRNDTLSNLRLSAACLLSLQDI